MISTLKSELLNMMELYNEHEVKHIVEDINLHNGALHDLEVFEMEFFNDVMLPKSPLTIATLVNDNTYSFCPYDSYFRMSLDNEGNIILISYDEYELMDFYKDNLDKIVACIFLYYRRIPTLVKLMEKCNIQGWDLK